MSCALALLLALAPAWAGETPAPAEPDWVGLARQLDSSKKKERLAAVSAAASLGQERAAAYLRPILTGDEDREVRLETAKALRGVPGEDAVALLGEGLADADQRVRQSVVEALRRRPEGSAELQLARALQDKKPEIRAAAALALGSRLAAGRAVLLVGGIDDTEASVREATLYALGAVGGEAAVEALSGVISADHKKKTKALAAEILGSMGSRAALPALVSALDDADEEALRPALQSAIRKILAQTPARVREEDRPAHHPPPAVSGSEPSRPPSGSASPVGAVSGSEPSRPPSGTASPVGAVSGSEPSRPPSGTASPVEKTVEFRLMAPKSRSVLLALDVLAGKRKTMARSVKGEWSVLLPLAPGRYRYQFIVDGERVLDPDNPRTERGASLREVP